MSVEYPSTCDGQLALGLAFNDTYAPGGLAALVSFARHRGSDRRAVVLTPAASEALRHSIDRLCERLEIDVDQIPVDPRLLPPADPENYLTSWSYAKLLVPELAPRALSRIVYIDADAFVQADVLDASRRVLLTRPFAAARDPWTPSRSVGPGLRGWSGPDAPYFSTGVLIFDCELWRSSGLTSAAFELGRHRPPWLVYQDQCALNAVTDGAFVQLGPAWNFPPAGPHGISFPPSSDLLGVPLDHMEQSALILHAMGRAKPWMDTFPVGSWKTKFHALDNEVARLLAKP